LVVGLLVGLGSLEVLGSFTVGDDFLAVSAIGLDFLGQTLISSLDRTGAVSAGAAEGGGDGTVAHDSRTHVGGTGGETCIG
jgi:hypothetical protein